VDGTASKTHLKAPEEGLYLMVVPDQFVFVLRCLEVTPSCPALLLFVDPIDLLLEITVGFVSSVNL
jgi:hypothetical protein